MGIVLRIHFSPQRNTQSLFTCDSPAPQGGRELSERFICSRSLDRGGPGWGWAAEFECGYLFAPERRIFGERRALLLHGAGFALQEVGDSGGETGIGDKVEALGRDGQIAA